MGFALSALLVGIGAFLFGLVPVFGALVGIAAVVLGILAVRKLQSKGLAIAGIVLGGLAILSSVGVTVGLGAAVNNSSLDTPAVVAPAATPKPEETTETKSTPEPAKVTETPKPVAPVVPVEFKSALTKAASYSELMHMSKQGIYDQLTSEYGEQFSPEAGQYAIDNLQADWSLNALEKAKEYQNEMAMSPAAIHDQLTSAYGEKFTAAEADYAIQHIND